MSKGVRVVLMRYKCVQCGKERGHAVTYGFRWFRVEPERRRGVRCTECEPGVQKFVEIRWNAVKRYWGT